MAYGLSRFISVEIFIYLSLDNTTMLTSLVSLLFWDISAQHILAATWQQLSNFDVLWMV